MPPGPARCCRGELPILLITPPGREHEAATRLARIGFDRVAGIAAGGWAELAAQAAQGAFEPASFARLDAAELHALRQQAAAPLVLDVRQPGEREQQHLDASLHIPLGQLPARIDELPRDGAILTQCAGGYRSMVALSLIARQRGQAAGLSDQRGGMNRWLEAGLPVTQGALSS